MPAGDTGTVIVAEALKVERKEGRKWMWPASS